MVLEWQPLAGSIPASAGEPHYTSEPVLRFMVYPRECGGTSRGYHLDSTVYVKEPWEVGASFRRR